MARVKCRKINGKWQVWQTFTEGTPFILPNFEIAVSYAFNFAKRLHEVGFRDA